VAGVVTIWNVFSAFSPYLDGIDVNGTRRSRRRCPCATRSKRRRLLCSLSELVAKSHDATATVYGRPPRSWNPDSGCVIEGKLVVTVSRWAPFRKGDIIERLDGTPALDVFAGLGALRVRRRRA